MNAIHRLILSAVALSAVVIGVCASPAAADDEPFYTDGGSATAIDGGTTPVTVDLGAHGACWNLAMRCEGAQSTRYALCAALPCPVTASNTLVDYDRLWDIPVNCSGSVGSNPAKRYLTLATDDGGIPNCKISHSPF